MKSEKWTVIKAPQLNVNDTEVFISEWSAAVTEFIKTGQVIAMLESSKGNAELKSEHDGWLIIMQQAGESIPVGKPIAVIACQNDEETLRMAREAFSVDAKAIVNEFSELELTDKARALVERFEIDSSLLPRGKILREKDIEAFMAQDSQETIVDALRKHAKELDRGILIIGAGSTAHMVIDTIRAIDNHMIIGILDAEVPTGKDIMGVPVIGKDSVENLQYIYDAGIVTAVNAVMSLNKPSIRESVFNKIVKVGFHLPCIIHPSAFIEPTANLDSGVFVHAKAYIGSNSFVGSNSFINTAAIISHDSNLGSTSIISPGAVLGGFVTIGEKTVIGMGTTIISHAKIGRQVVIVNGCNVFTNIEDGARVKK